MGKLVLKKLTQYILVSVVLLYIVYNISSDIQKYTLKLLHNNLIKLIKQDNIDKNIFKYNLNIYKKLYLKHKGTNLAEYSTGNKEWFDIIEDEYKKIYIYVEDNFTDKIHSWNTNNTVNLGFLEKWYKWTFISIEKDSKWKEIIKLYANINNKLEEITVINFELEHSFWNTYSLRIDTLIDKEPWNIFIYYYIPQKLNIWMNILNWAYSVYDGIIGDHSKNMIMWVY